jgi:hypothetical protein
MDLLAMLSELNFLETKKIYNRPSIVDFFHNRSRCGIYLLHFSDGTYYIGQAIDIPRRYTQHRKKHNDITHISFKNVKKDDLNSYEAEAIRKFESKFQLRNISLASAPAMDADLDELLHPDRQSEWLEEKIPSVIFKKRIVDKTLRSKYSLRFCDLKRNSFFIEQILPVLKKYVSICIPEPYLTEISFWGSSCLPAHESTTTIEIYSRINMYWQEVFTVGKMLEQKLPLFSWHLSKKIIASHLGENFKSTFKTYKTIEFDDHYYESGGFDQFAVYIYDTDEAMLLLDNNSIIEAIKNFNLRCMRKGAHIHAPYHCMHLADLILP